MCFHKQERYFCKIQHHGGYYYYFFDHQQQHPQQASLFSTGRNLSNLCKVYIRIVANGGIYNGAIQRIFLEFEKPLSESRVPFYDGRGTTTTTTSTTSSGDDDYIERVLEISKNDPIVRVLVWENESHVKAISFQMNSGTISEVYGLLGSCSGLGATTTKSYRADYPNSKLVGIYGRFDNVLGTLGFSFARVVDDVDENEDMETSAFLQRQNYEDAWVGRAIFVSIFISTVLASLISSSRRN